MNEKYFTITSKQKKDVFIHAIPGHFVAAGNHLNYYIGTSDIKHNYKVSKQAAKLLSEYYILNGTEVETVFCLYETETLGGFIANELCSSRMMNKRAHENVYVISPEIDTAGNMFFRDNLRKMIDGRKALIVISCITSGRTVEQAMECIEYYGGETVGVAAAFSAVGAIQGVPVRSIFGLDDVPDYKAVPHAECEMCKAGKPIEAVSNGHGFSKLL